MEKQEVLNLGEYGRHFLNPAFGLTLKNKANAKQAEVRHPFVKLPGDPRSLAFFAREFDQ